MKSDERSKRIKRYSKMTQEELRTDKKHGLQVQDYRWVEQEQKSDEETETG